MGTAPDCSAAVVHPVSTGSAPDRPRTGNTLEKTPGRNLDADRLYRAVSCADPVGQVYDHDPHNVSREGMLS